MDSEAGEGAAKKRKRSGRHKAGSRQGAWASSVQRSVKDKVQELEEKAKSLEEQLAATKEELASTKSRMEELKLELEVRRREISDSVRETKRMSEQLMWEQKWRIFYEGQVRKK